MLVVDDNVALRSALVRSIRHAGHDAEGFESAEALLASDVPARDACLVLDLKLPGIDGRTLKQRLAASGRDLPTVFITALPPEESRPPLAAVPAARVLQKPFTNKDLLDAIGQAAG